MTQSLSGTGSPTFEYTCDGNAMEFVSNGTTIELKRVDPVKGEPYF